MAYVQYPKPRPSLTRARATQLLERVVARAAEINADPMRFPLAVRRLLIFGSYLTDKEVLGDLDVAVELAYVRNTWEFMGERPRWRAIHWANKTYVALQVRQPKFISIHNATEIDALDTPKQVVFVDTALRVPGRQSSRMTRTGLRRCFEI